MNRNPTEMTGEGQCTGNDAAHEHDEYVRVQMEPLWSLANISCYVTEDFAKEKDTL